MLDLDYSLSFGVFSHFVIEEKKEPLLKRRYIGSYIIVF